MELQSSGWLGLILSERFRTQGWIAQEIEGLEERLWILRHWASGRKSRAKGRGTGWANRLSSRGLRELRPGILSRHFFFLPSPIFFLYLCVAFSSNLILVLFVPMTSIRNGIILCCAILIAFISVRKCFDAV